MREDPFAFVLPFVATAEAKSFRVAARQLGVTPSSISKAMSKLESDLGVSLLRRTSRSVTMTDEGEAFLRRCKIAVDEMRAARGEVAVARISPRGKLRVSLPPALGRLVVVPALPQLLARHPLLEVDLVFTDRFVQLATDRVDVALRIGKVDDVSAVARRLRTVSWKTVASPTYLARRGTPTTHEQLSTHDLLAFVLPSGKRQSFRFKDRTNAVSVETRGGFTADDGLALVDAAVAGLGIVQAHDYMTAEHVARGKLVELLADVTAPGPALSVLSARAEVPSPNARAFLDFAVTVLGEKR